MHDPMTVAFEIRSPFKKRGQSYRSSLVTIWHVDPESDGTDDSCDWFQRRLNKAEKAWRDQIVDDELDTIRIHFPETMSSYDIKHILSIAMVHSRRFYKPRHWWQHPRWHLHHWKIQVHLLQKLHRWLFVRCAKCGGHFHWDEGVIGSWDGDRIWHFSCDDSGVRIAGVAEEVSVE